MFRTRHTLGQTDWAETLQNLVGMQGEGNTQKPLFTIATTFETQALIKLGVTITAAIVAAAIINKAVKS